MKNKNDWRLQGQEKYLKGVVLNFEKYKVQRKDWEHDHCEFCYIKFSEVKKPDTLTEGYTTDDHYRWICESCYNDFKDIFGWKISMRK